MNIYELIIKRRSIRKFKQEKISDKDLIRFVNAARVAPSMANFQPLEYIIVPKNLNEIFQCTKWAKYLKNGTPKTNERPLAYIVILSNENITKNEGYDVGLAIANIIYTALEKGIGSCIIGSLDREKLVRILNIPENYQIKLIIALGYPNQEAKECKIKDGVKYWLNDKNVMCVPKRDLDKIMHKETFTR